MAFDVAGIEYVIDPSKAEQGAKRATSALDALEKRTEAFVAKVTQLQNQLGKVLKFPAIGGGAGGTGGGTGAAISQAERLAKAQQKAADEAFRHAQALA